MADENLNQIGHHPDPPTWGIPRKVLFTSGAPTQTGWEGQPAIDQDTGDIYIYQSGAWVQTSSGGGGGTTQIATGSSDPVGAPAAGIVLFVRTDVVRVLKWDGAAWVVEYSEI